MKTRYALNSVGIIALSCISLTLSMKLLETHHTLEFLVCTCNDRKHAAAKIVFDKYDLMGIGDGKRICGVAVSKMRLDEAIKGIKEPHYMLRFNYPLLSSHVDKPLYEDVPVLAFVTENDPVEQRDDGKLPVYFRDDQLLPKEVLGNPFRGSTIHRSKPPSSDKNTEANLAVVLVPLDDMEEKSVSWDKTNKVTSSDENKKYPILFAPENIPKTAQSSSPNVLRPTLEQATYVVFLLQDLIKGLDMI